MNNNCSKTWSLFAQVPTMQCLRKKSIVARNLFQGGRWQKIVLPANVSETPIYPFVSLTDTHFLTLCQASTHTHALSHKQSLSLSCKHSLPLTHTQTNTLSSHTHSLTHTHSLSNSGFSLSLSLLLFLTLSLAHIVFCTHWLSLDFATSFSLSLTLC